ncbi:MAG: hypothetical protein AAF678_05935 [Pseudomonadota bacterium]
MASRRTMSETAGHDTDILRHSIDELASERAYAYGDLFKVDGNIDAALKLCFAEINRTVLPRLITLTCHPVGHVRLVVSHRRLFELHVPEKSLPEASHDADDIQSLAQELVAVLQDVFHRSQSVCIEAPEPISAGGETSLSCSIRLLQDVSGVHLPIEADGDRVAMFIDHLQAIATAWRVSKTDSGQTGSYGSDANKDLLEKLASVICATAKTQGKDQFPKEKDSFFVYPLGDGKLFVSARTSDMEVIALTGPEQSETLRFPWIAAAD